MTKWLQATVSLEREGDPPPDGVGCIRVVTRRPLRVREQITEVEAPSRLAYRLLSGLPVRHYVGQTTLTGDGRETDIRWTIDFTSPVPGMAYVVRLAIQAAATNLAADPNAPPGTDERGSSASADLASKGAPAGRRAERPSRARPALPVTVIC